jgi:hypothetical protein
MAPELMLLGLEQIKVSQMRLATLT